MSLVNFEDFRLLLSYLWVCWLIDFCCSIIFLIRRRETFDYFLTLVFILKHVNLFFSGLKGLLRSLIDLLKNKTYVFSCLGLTVKIIFAAALGGFYTKIIVLKFGGSLSQVSLLSAAVFIPANTREFSSCFNIVNIRGNRKDVYEGLISQPIQSCARVSDRSISIHIWVYIFPSVEFLIYFLTF